MKTSSRRRGNDLKIAIYQVTNDLLASEGINAVNFTRVAQLAHTSRSVLYRYWAQPFDLIFEAVMHHNYAEQNLVTFNHGSLREDLLFLANIWLDKSKDTTHQTFKQLLTALPTGHQRTDVMEQATATNLKMMGVILRFAIQRGEIQHFPPVSTQLSFFHLARYLDLMDEAPINKEDILSVIDDVVLPALLYMGNTTQ